MDKPTNVRPGDRAFVTRGTNAGRIVDVVREYRFPEVLPGHFYPYAGEDGTVRWVCESTGSPLKAVTVVERRVVWSPLAAIPDSYLRPLRDNDQEDEMVSRVGRAPVSDRATKQRERV